MVKFTPNYNLGKPEGTDMYSILPQNANMDILDTTLKSVETDAKNAATDSSLALEKSTETESLISIHLEKNVQSTEGVHGLKIEGGTFTPIVEGTTTIGSPTYLTQNGYYRLIEKMLFFDLTLGISDKGSMDGNIVIRGLPFVPVSSNADRKASVTVGVAHNLNFASIGKLDALIELNGLIVPLITTVEGNNDFLATTLCGNNLFLRISGTYEIQ